MHPDLFETLASHASVGNFAALKLALDVERDQHVKDPQFLYLDGLHASRTGNLPQAIELLSQAANLSPRVPAPRFELGFALSNSQRPLDAALAYEAALNLDAKHVPAWINLGFARLRLGEYARAELAFSAALGTDASFPEAWIGMAQLHEAAGKPALAVEVYQGMRKRFGAEAKRDLELTRLLTQKGDFAAASMIQREALARNPNDAVAQHLLGGLEGKSHLRANAGYVRAVYDAFAPHYDSYMAASTRIDLPRKLAATMQAALPAGGSILDVGCGTGLVGANLRGYNLTGVDVSSRMLEFARTRNYRQLMCADLDSFLTAAPDHSLDALIACDALIYFGELSSFCQQASRVLKGGGLLSITVNTDDTTFKFVQAPNGRYTHARTYVDEQLQRAGFSQVSCERLERPDDAVLVFDARA